MTVVMSSAALLAIAVLAVLAITVAGSLAAPALAAGAAAAAFGALALIAQPFLGVVALVTFSHLDAVEKLLFGFLPVSAFKLIAAATFAALLLTARRFRAQVRAMLRDPVAVMVMAFLILAAISTIWADDTRLAMSAVRRTLSLGLLFMLVVVLADSYRKVALLLWILVATSLVSALIMIVDFATGLQLVAQSDAATTARTFEGVARSAGGSDSNPTTAAALLLVGTVFALVHAIESPVWRRRLLVMVAIGTVAVVLSFARSAVLVFGVIALALVWRYRRWRHMPLLVAAAGLAGLAVLPLVPAEYWQRLSSIFGLASDPTLGRRLSYNLIGIDLFVQNPLFGVGPGNFVHHFTDAAYRYMPGRTLVGRELHNMYLSVLVQYGLVGAFPFFAILALSFRQLRAVRADPAHPAMRVHALALGYAFAAYLLVSFFLPNEGTKYTWLLPALAIALNAVNERERSRPCGS
ncbi:O-antigen ligase family protein [Roseivivax sp. CAU 1761]